MNINNNIIDQNTRFWKKVKKTNSCWNWIAGTKTSGYGLFWNKNKMVSAHRFSFELFNGKIPNKLTLDHLCRNPRCVNPLHLEAVTLKENILRGDSLPAINKRKTHCKNNHLLTEDSTYHPILRNDTVARLCKQCFKNYKRNRYQRSRRLFVY